jgi:hypothetical protein
MNKFLNLVENNLPPQDLDKNREVLRNLQQLFSKAGITSSLKTFSDTVTVTVGDKIIDLELKHISQASEEEAEDPASTIKAITAIASLPDQGLGKQLTSSTARKLQMARRNMASAAEKISKDFLAAANSTQ